MVSDMKRWTRRNVAKCRKMSHEEKVNGTSAKKNIMPASRVTTFSRKKLRLKDISIKRHLDKNIFCLFNI